MSRRRLAIRKHSKYKPDLKKIAARRRASHKRLQRKKKRKKREAKAKRTKGFEEKNRKKKKKKNFHTHDKCQEILSLQGIIRVKILFFIET